MATTEQQVDQGKLLGRAVKELGVARPYGLSRRGVYPAAGVWFRPLVNLGIMSEKWPAQSSLPIWRLIIPVCRYWNSA